MEVSIDVRPQQPPPGPAGQQVRDGSRPGGDGFSDPRAIAALAVGLAYAGVGTGAAVTELATSGELTLLSQARDQVDDLVRHAPASGPRARYLLESAIVHTPGQVAGDVGSNRTGPVSPVTDAATWLQPAQHRPPQPAASRPL